MEVKKSALLKRAREGISEGASQESLTDLEWSVGWAKGYIEGLQDGQAISQDEVIALLSEAEKTESDTRASFQGFENNDAAVAAIAFALEDSEGMAFLRCWNEGNFDAIRREWPEAPEDVFIGADPLHKSTSKP